MSIKYIAVMYLVIVNIVAYAMYGIDKKKAKKNKRRISEASLLTVAIAGGSLGAFAAMKTYRHKTQKIKFSVGVPMIILVQIGLLIYFYKEILIW